MARVTVSPDQQSLFDVAGDVDQIQPEVNHVDQDHVDQDLQVPADVALPVKHRAKEDRRQRIADVLEHALAPSTIKSYARQFRRFEKWCSANDEVALPAEPEVIADYLIERAEARYTKEERAAKGVMARFYSKQTRRLKDDELG